MRGPFSGESDGWSSCRRVYEIRLTFANPVGTTGGEISGFISDQRWAENGGDMGRSAERVARANVRSELKRWRVLRVYPASRVAPRNDDPHLPTEKRSIVRWFGCSRSAERSNCRAAERL
jgi:hypothetical protein